MHLEPQRRYSLHSVSLTSVYDHINAFLQLNTILLIVMPLYATSTIFYIAALSWIATAAPHCQSQQPATVGRAIYFLTNEATNAIVALPIGSDGMLSKGSITKTGGAGSVSIDSATKKPALTDALNSQSSLTIVKEASRPPRCSYPTHQVLTMSRTFLQSTQAQTRSQCLLSIQRTQHVWA
jgi:hypothetical protein